jgi:hypothetical protein
MMPPEKVSRDMDHMSPANAVESASDAEDGEEDAGDAFEYSIPDTRAGSRYNTNHAILRPLLPCMLKIEYMFL